MNLEIEPFSFKNPKHTAAIPQLTAWTGVEGEVLELNEQSINSHPYKLIAFDEDSQQLAGYVAVTAEFMPQMIKMGGWVVNPEFRRQGIGTVLAKQMLSDIPFCFPDAEIVTAVVNEVSKRKFESLGATAVGEISAYWYLNQTYGVSRMASSLKSEKEAIRKYKDYYKRKKYQ